MWNVVELNLRASSAAVEFLFCLGGEPTITHSSTAQSVTQSVNHTQGT
jgi:hypothetical protein